MILSKRCLLAHHTFLKVRQFFILNNYTINNTKCSKEEMKNKIQLIKSEDIRVDLGEILPETLR